MAEQKQEIITFKADLELAEILKNIPNRSQFIRSAILKSLENLCPLCEGTGILSPCQKEHWETFAKHHNLSRCNDCELVYLKCEHDSVKAGKKMAKKEKAS
ncbi:MAG: CopG family transcriptional regulator [Spirochaetaceae bacterium]|nr:MAG: CopG family transcriptional regulator [Spirochaetaceae bacterium]